MANQSVRLRDHFQSLTDPRKRPVVYPLTDILVIAVCAVIGGADDYVSIADFGRAKKDWFLRVFGIKAIPSHDRFNAVLAAIRPAEFEKCLLSLITALQEMSAGQIIAIDGKTLRGSYDRASSKAAIHMVSAWATANHLTLGQVVVDEKSNEITAIPELLEMLELHGALVTIDAMGCQTEIAERIVDRGGDYCLAVKGNQRTLHRGVKAFFESRLEDDFAGTPVRRHTTCERGHGREEERWYYVCPVPKDLPNRGRWKGLRAIGMTMNKTTRDGRTTVETRYYLLSKRLPARRFAAAVRGHWGIENSLNWVLDVAFGEDRSRIRKGHADANFGLLRRLALSLLKAERTAKVGVKNKRLTAGWNEEYLAKVLTGT
jgi:predicted transposase YbfD/YdcC